MIYLITGKLLSLESYFLYCSVCYSEPLKTFENLFGWFLLEHIFEEYCTTPGKLFMVYEDFRTLMTNVLLITRNLFFVAQFFTAEEFLLINVFIILLVVINKDKLRFNKFKFFIVFIYLSLFNSFFLLSIFNIFNALIYIIFFSSFILFIGNYFFLFYWYVFIKLSVKKKLNLYLKLTLIKLIFIIVIFFIFIFLHAYSLNLYAKINDNLMQEFVIKNLIIYLYAIYNI